ncbi:MarR family winged helix-turn-helix transcriptional regulator [Jiella marina]|uniref:MarR family winged helix-turn-helix transcriptional regulator n=1 Tax=Jiella sp. LLJ827 TaxID=2917712 RepID=UPI002101BDA5|nr:MarR family transcriptional regulator [Jiella sp. LLJ827]MCQ0989656.1 MarR family transcriptional regulator [Jiella sp. LLJ827]
MTFDKDRSAGYLVNHMARLFARALQERIAPLGLSTGTFPVLLVLWEDEGLTQRDLVARLDIEQATMANTLTRMERDGLITRKKDPSDGRVQRIWLTQRARQLHEPATQAANEVNEIALSNLTEEEKQTFLDLIARVITRLGEGER